MDKVFIRNLRARSVIGVNDWERKTRQDIIINIELFVETDEAGEKDDLAHSVDYRAISKDVLEHVENSYRFTVEALAKDVATICLKHPHVGSVTVRLEKPGAVRFADSAGVEIHRTR
ncbi:MAG: dihydroneopterin aldolase [Deltaproteobacteria bacterium]|nr:dihydroneopterin aldolase [Deltaproteobacteria bacterium]